MAISYRMKKNELIFLLDLYGDVNSLEQRFGNVYISSEEHEKTARRLDEKGIVTLSGNKAMTDNAFADIIERFYTSPLVLADEKLDMWLYCSADMAVAVRKNNFFADEFILTPVFENDSLCEMINEDRTLRFTVYRGGNGEMPKDEAAKFLKEYGYGK